MFTYSVNDIALIKLTKPLEYSRKVLPIALASYKRCANALGVSSGWGRTNANKPVVSQFLKQVELPFVDYWQCLAIYPNYLTDGMICAGPAEGGKSRMYFCSIRCREWKVKILLVLACNGDSGGPLVEDDELIGINSWTWGCAIPGKPAVFTDVFYFKDWIERTMNENWY